MKAMVDHGINVLVTESNGANCLHILVFLVFLEPETEEMRVDIYKYLLQILDTESIKILLEGDSLEFRPLEFAAHLQTFQLFSAMFDTPGIYLVKRETYGIYCREYFDITIYESTVDGSRCSKSPLGLFGLLDKRNMEKQNVKHFYKSELIQSWLNAKYSMNKFWIWPWVLARMVMVSIFMMSDETWSMRDAVIDNGNVTDYPCPVSFKWYTMPLQNMVAFILAIYSGGIILFDIIEISYWVYIKEYKYLQTPKGYKNLAVHFWFYRITQFVLASSLFLLSINILTCYEENNCALPKWIL